MKAFHRSAFCFSFHGEKSLRARLSDFANRLRDEWRRLKLPEADERIVVAVSGGADSCALLIAFSELIKQKVLNVKMVIAHFDHGLRGDAGEEDARFVSDLCAQMDVQAIVGRGRVAASAKAVKDNLEQAARRARYEFLLTCARRNDARYVLTAHTMDDQAETVLMRLLRGAGSEGLSGIDPVRTLDDKHEDVQLVRPLLAWARRAETEAFCVASGVAYRTDEMNADENFTRVRVRRKLLPLLQTFNPRHVETINRTAGLLREDAEALQFYARELLDAATCDAADAKAVAQNVAANASDTVEHLSPALDVEKMRFAPAAIRRRALRLWLARSRGDLRGLEHKHLIAVETLWRTGARGGKRIELPSGDAVVRRGRLIVFVGRNHSAALENKFDDADVGNVDL